MEMGVLWNAVLSLAIGMVIYNFRTTSDEMKRIQILINRTREEVAKEYVTKSEVHADINRVLDRIERMDEKLDRIIEAKQWDGVERRSR